MHTILTNVLLVNMGVSTLAVLIFSLLILKEKPLGIIVAGFLRPSRTATIAFSVLMMLEDHQSKQQQQSC